jgi:hypothetical protein
MSTDSKSSRPPCPYCGSCQILKNGSTHHKKPKYKCKDCGRQYIENPTKKYISNSTKELIKKLLLERISLRGIARVVDVSIKWLQQFVNKFYRDIPYLMKVTAENITNLIVECDEIWSFVNSKENPVYIWLAIDRKTRKIIGVHFGDRSRKDAQELWDSLPEEYQKDATFYTDFWESYKKVIPDEQHKPSDKSTGETNHIERFNNTLRQRCSRLVRKSLSFSKNCFNHEAAILYFIHHYNEQLVST